MTGTTDRGIFDQRKIPAEGRAEIPGAHAPRWAALRTGAVGGKDEAREDPPGREGPPYHGAIGPPIRRSQGAEERVIPHEIKLSGGPISEHVGDSDLPAERPQERPEPIGHGRRHVDGGDAPARAGEPMRVVPSPTAGHEGPRAPLGRPKLPTSEPFDELRMGLAQIPGGITRAIVRFPLKRLNQSLAPAA